MQSTINLMNINPVPAKNARRVVPVNVPLVRLFGISKINPAGGGDSDVENPAGSLNFGVRRGLGRCLMRIDPWAAGEHARPSGRPHT